MKGKNKKREVLSYNLTSNKKCLLCGGVSNSDLFHIRKEADAKYNLKIRDSGIYICASCLDASIKKKTIQECDYGFTEYYDILKK